MSAEMVEQVARAISVRPDPNNPCSDDYKAARAAIEAMRVPTEAMLKAGLRSVYSDMDAGDIEGLWQGMIDAAFAGDEEWRAMIASALSNTGPGKGTT